MESNDEVQEIDPSVITQFRRKKYQWRVLKEELNVRFCCRSKRHNNNVENCQD
jgi:hypothetical protein